ncbi:Lysophosphatidylcholine acyltransferase 2 [Perkinsus chesapeaki]|uniref:Lysophosphatidylcholine acyltransferase 2 n=1 Tax=Perkinsus chesapeaki TaxID=330153 RepID=A0A7J6MR26_PERCH|nr:Lysophosphatidylcholine acyltransferase 2 [Perkinsus chesapeaki]
MLSFNPPAPSDASWVLMPVGALEPESAAKSRRGQTNAEWDVLKMALEYYRHHSRETRLKIIVNSKDAVTLPGQLRSYAVIVPSRAWSGALSNVISWTLMLSKQLLDGGYSCQILTNQNWDRIDSIRDCGQVDENLLRWWSATGRKMRIAFTVVDGLFRPHAKPADTPPGEMEGVEFDKATETLVRYWCLFAFVFCFGIIPEVHGYSELKHFSKKSFIIVSNHVSCMEILILLFLFYPTFVGKKALINTPVVGRVMKSMHCIFVDRLAAKGEKQQSTTEIIHNYISSAGGGTPVLLFPEGTTTNGLGLIPFRSGAFRQGIPVLPIAVTYPNYKPGETFDPHFTAIKGVPYALGLMAQPYTVMRIQILLPESRRGDEAPQQFAERVREMMAQSLDERLIPGTYQDKVAVEGAIRRGDIPTRMVNKFALQLWDTKEE